MGDTIWGQTSPGDKVMRCEEDPTALLMGDLTPDHVRLPDELGGTQHKVESVEVRPCVDPKCRDASLLHDAKHYALHGSDVFVCGCEVRHRWTFYQYGSKS